MTLSLLLPLTVGFVLGMSVGVIFAVAFLAFMGREGR